jgi:hypothetical protein
MNATPLTFPVLAFGPNVGRNAVRGRESLDYFVGEDDFSTCTSWRLKHGARQGMLLADSAGRCWRIVRVEDLGVTRGFLERILRFLVRQSLHRISQEIVEEAPLSLHDLRDRVCASITADPDSWRDDEVIAGEDGPLRDEQELLDELKAAVQMAKTVAEVINVLYSEPLAG